MPARRVRTTPIPAPAGELFEEFHKYRQIHTDGRSLPVDPDPAWYGYSIGKWEGDTFVVDSVHFNDETWFDRAGNRPVA